MNTTLFYLDKQIEIILLNTVKESCTELPVNIDFLEKKQVKLLIENFINHSVHKILLISTAHVDIAIDKINKSFKVIYAAGGLIQQASNFLFIKRMGKWDLPKGKLDEDETITTAAIRECEEECGVKNLTIIQQLSPTYHFYFLKHKLTLKKTFWYLMQTNYTGLLTPQLEEKIEEVKWIAKKDIEIQIFANTYPAIQHMFKVMD